MRNNSFKRKNTGIKRTNLINNKNNKRIDSFFEIQQRSNLSNQFPYKKNKKQNLILIR